MSSRDICESRVGHVWMSSRELGEPNMGCMWESHMNESQHVEESHTHEFARHMRVTYGLLCHICESHVGVLHKWVTSHRRVTYTWVRATYANHIWGDCVTYEWVRANLESQICESHMRVTHGSQISMRHVTYESPTYLSSRKIGEPKMGVTYGFQSHMWVTCGSHTWMRHIT